MLCINCKAEVRGGYVRHKFNCVGRDAPITRGDR